MAARVRVVGGARLRRNLRRAEVEMPGVKDLNARLSKYLAIKAAARAPKRSGRLAASVRGSKAKAKISVLAGRKALPYVGPIHWGWPNRPNKSRGWRGGPIAPNTFLTDAAKSSERYIVGEWTKGVQSLLNSVKGA